jgi:uncharacterized protein YjbJ (UPF0337 family)
MSFQTADVSRRVFMSSTTDKISGLANKAAGIVKGNIGKAIGSEKLEAEGVIQETKGDAERIEESKGKLRKPSKAE